MDAGSILMLAWKALLRDPWVKVAFVPLPCDTLFVQVRFVRAASVPISHCEILGWLCLNFYHSCQYQELLGSDMRAAIVPAPIPEIIIWLTLIDTIIQIGLNISRR